MNKYIYIVQRDKVVIDVLRSKKAVEKYIKIRDMQIAYQGYGDYYCKQTFQNETREYWIKRQRVSNL